MDFYVDQDADDFVADLWREFGDRSNEAPVTPEQHREHNSLAR